MWLTSVDTADTSSQRSAEYRDPEEGGGRRGSYKEGELQCEALGSRNEGKDSREQETRSKVK